MLNVDYDRIQLISEKKKIMMQTKIYSNNNDINDKIVSSFPKA